MRRRALLVVPLVVAALPLLALHNGLCWDDLEFTFARGGRLLSAGLTGDLLAEANPGQEGLGTIQQRFIEVSNVDVTEELVNMIITQRAYEVNSKTVTTADKLLEIANTLVR